MADGNPQYRTGEPLLRRYLRGASVSWLQACRVVSDDDRGLLVWLAAGSGFGYRRGPDGDALRARPIEEWAAAELVTTPWDGSSVLILMPPGVAHSVWWFFTADGAFRNWYVNLEDRPAVGVVGGQAVVDVIDHELDIVARPDRSWEWKDEDELQAVTGWIGYWDEAKAAAIRAEGERLAALIDAGAFPFDGTWCDYRPDLDWTPLALPSGAGADIR